MKEAFPLDFRSKNKSIEATDYKGLDLMTLNFLLTLFSLLTFSTVFSFYYVLSLLKNFTFNHPNLFAWNVFLIMVRFWIINLRFPTLGVSNNFSLAEGELYGSVWNCRLLIIHSHLCTDNYFSWTNLSALVLDN